MQWAVTISYRPTQSLEPMTWKAVDLQHSRIPMPLSPATRLGPYEIVSSMGAEGMGEVYRARDTRLNRTVAMKVLPEHLSADPQLRERFDRDAKAISSLSHPHICALPPA